MTSNVQYGIRGVEVVFMYHPLDDEKIITYIAPTVNINPSFNTHLVTRKQSKMEEGTHEQQKNRN